jgi:WD40 repeat protein
VKILECITWKEVTKLTHCSSFTESCRLVAWSPCGSLLASVGTDRRCVVWQARSWNVVYQASHETDISCLTWAPSASLLALSLGDNYGQWIQWSHFLPIQSQLLDSYPAMVDPSKVTASEDPIMSAGSETLATKKPKRSLIKASSLLENSTVAKHQLMDADPDEDLTKETEYMYDEEDDLEAIAERSHTLKSSNVDVCVCEQNLFFFFFRRWRKFGYYNTATTLFSVKRHSDPI